MVELSTVDVHNVQNLYNLVLQNAWNTDSVEPSWVYLKQTAGSLNVEASKERSHQVADKQQLVFRLDQRLQNFTDEPGGGHRYYRRHRRSYMFSHDHHNHN